MPPAAFDVSMTSEVRVNAAQAVAAGNPAQAKVHG